MICKHCHKNNNYNHKYCFYCGELLIEEEQDDIVKQQPVDNNLKTNNPIVSSDTNVDAVKNINVNTNIDTDIDEDDTDLQEMDSDFKNLFFNIDEPEKLATHKKRTLPYLITTVLLAFIIILLIIIKPFNFLTNKQNTSSEEIILTYTIESTQTEEGDDAQQVLFYVSGGKSISLLGQSATIDENGQANFLITNGVIEQMATVSDDNLTLQATIYGENGTKKEEKISFSALATPATFTLLNPTGLSSESQADNFSFEAQLAPSSSIFINDENYSDRIDEQGLISIILPIDITQSKTIYNLRIEEPNKTSLNETLTVTYTSDITELYFDSDISVPLIIDSSEKTITITGKATPKTKITSSEIDTESIVLEDSGIFSLTIEPQHIGYNLFTLSFSLSDKTIEKNIIVDYTPSLTEYLQSAWAPDPYDYITKIEDFHKGEHFLLTGTIDRILSKDNTKTSFLIKLESESDVNEIYYIEYWGDFNYKVNDLVKVFGNKWGNKEDYPLILCKKIALKK